MCLEPENDYVGWDLGVFSLPMVKNKALVKKGNIQALAAEVDKGKKIKDIFLFLMWPFENK